MINDLLEKNKVIVLENLVEKTLQDEIENEILSAPFPWYFMPATVPIIYDIPTDYNKQNLKNYYIKDYLQFSHSFIEQDKISGGKINSPYVYLIEKLMNCFYTKTNFKKTGILRAKINMQTQHNENKNNCICMPHIDFDLSHYVLIYYVNSCDGDTLIFNKNLDISHRITPIKGNFLLFEGSLLHTGTNPKFFDKRLIINIDLIK